MAASADEICSLACEELGHTGFLSFGSTSDPHHRAAERAWPTVRDHVLARHAWDGSIKRVLLTADGTPPAFGFQTRFALPADWLRTLTVGNPDQDGRMAYRVEGGFLLIDYSSNLALRYIYRLLDVTKYPPLLTDLMIAGMRARLAYRITQSTTKSDAERAEFTRLLASAAAVDAAEEDGEVFGDFPLLQARFG